MHVLAGLERHVWLIFRLATAVAYSVVSLAKYNVGTIGSAFLGAKPFAHKMATVLHDACVSETGWASQVVFSSFAHNDLVYLLHLIRFQFSLRYLVYKKFASSMFDHSASRIKMNGGRIEICVMVVFEYLEAPEAFACSYSSNSEILIELLK